MAPKIRPVRRASENFGLWRVAPFPIEAAKASMDMPKARRIVAEIFIKSVQTGDIHMTHHCPQ
ncbi:hypothetical protein D3C76_1845560 [compost metagenome]